MTGIMCAFAGIGSGALDTQVVTVANYFYSDKFGSITIWGFDLDTGTGSCADGTSNIYSGAAIYDLYWINDTFAAFEGVKFRVAGTFSNSGWTTMTVDGTPYARTSAAFTSSGGYTFWEWATGTNPFGTTPSATKTVVFT